MKGNVGVLRVGRLVLGVNARIISSTTHHDVSSFGSRHGESASLAASRESLGNESEDRSNQAGHKKGQEGSRFHGDD